MLAQVTAALGAGWSRVAGMLSFSRVQAVVGVLAGIVSVTGAVVSVVEYVRPSNTGELVALVQDAGSHRPVSDASIEVLTPDNALVATLTPDRAGRAARSLREGVYVVRVSHPRYAAEVRHIQVSRNQTIEIKTALRTGSSSSVNRSINDGFRAVRRALHF